MRCAEKEGWSHRQVLRHLCESEAVERGQKRTARLLSELGLPETKSLSTLDEMLLPAKVRRQLLISSNLVFSQWDQIFKDPMTTMAAIDRLVHHSIILEFVKVRSNEQTRPRMIPRASFGIGKGGADSTMVHRQVGEQQGKVGIHNLVWEGDAQRAFFAR